MAQILKFNNGGSAAPKWGTFTIGDVTYEMTEDNIASLHNHAKTLNNDVQYQFGFIIDALRSGQNLTYANNVLTGNINWDVGEGQAKKIKSRVGRGLGKGRDARLAISSLDDLTLTKPEPKEKILKFQDRQVKYEKGEDGKFVLTEGKKKYIASAHNQEIIDFLNTIKEYSLSEEPFKIEGLDKDETWLRNWYKENSNEFENILGRITTGDSSPSDKEILNEFLIYLDEVKPSTTATPSQTQPVKPTSAPRTGSGQRYSGGSNFGTRPTGVTGGQQTSTLTINSPEFLNYLNSFGKGVWINEDFVKAYPEYGKLLEGFSNGVFYINGQAYDANDPQLLQNETFKRFVEDNKKHPGSNEVIVQTFTNPQEGWRPLNQFGKKQYYSAYENSIVKDLTGQYTLQPFEVENGIIVTPKYLFQLYPKTIDENMYDQFGRIKPEFFSYAIIDNAGKWVTYDNYDWTRYISQLKSKDAKNRTAYYSKQPNYLYKYLTNGKNRLIDLGNGIFYAEKQNRYIVIEKQNGKQRALLLKTSFAPGKGVHPLHISTDNTNKRYYDQVEMKDGKYISVDLSTFGVTLKCGGSIPKANSGLKFPKLYGDNNFLLQNEDFTFGSKPFTITGLTNDSNGNIPSWMRTDIPEDFKKSLSEQLPLIYEGVTYVPSSVNLETMLSYGPAKPGDTRFVSQSYYDYIRTKVSENLKKSASETTPDGTNNYGSSTDSNLSFLPSEVTGIVRLINNLQSSNKSHQIVEKYADLAKRNILSMQAPQKSTPIYVEPAENRLIDKQIADTLNKQYAYSDPVLIEKMKDKDIATTHYLETQKSANSSQAFNQHRLMSQQVNDENSAARVNLNNNILQSLNGINQMEMNSELASSNTKADSLSKYLLETQDKFAKFEDQYREALVSKKNLDTIKTYENDLENAFKAAGGADKLSADSKILYDTYGFRPAMLKEIDPTEYERITRKFQLQTSIDKLNYGRMGLLSIYPELDKTEKLRHGAKLSKLTTQMLLKQGKNSVDINKLNKEIMKIFQKLIK